MIFSEPSEKLIKETIKFWSEKYGYTISKEDALEIIHNLRGFASVLIDWYNEDKEFDNK